MTSRKQKRFRLNTERMEDRLVPAGALDAAFSDDGMRTLDFGGTDTARAVAVQDDGKAVVVGSFDAGSSDFAVARLDPDGKLDPFFNGPLGGTNTVSFGGIDHATAVIIQADGKIVVVGYTDAGGNNDFAIARLNPNGTLDDTFDGDGRRTIDFGAEDKATAVAIQDNGKIVVAGSSGFATSDFAVARLESNGQLDPFFNGPFGGTQTINFGFIDHATGVAIQDDGGIVLSGYTDINPTDDFAVARLTPSGALDTSFDTDGRRTIDFGGEDRAKAVAIDSLGRIVAAGSHDAGSSDFAIARLQSNGQLDPFFNGPFGGTQTVPFGGAEFATGVAIQPDGKIVVTGYTDANGSVLDPNDFAVTRLTSGGSLDNSFDADGKATVGFGGNDQANGVALQPDGRIVVAGSRSALVGGTDFAVARLAGDEANLSVTLQDGVGDVPAGGTVTYTIAVFNAGLDPVTGAQLIDAFPAELTGVTYTSVVSGGATGNTASGSGNISDVLTLPAGALVFYTVTGTLSPAAVGTLSNTASVTTPGVFDADPSDNSATDTNVVVPAVALATTVTDGVTSVTAGSVVTYTITVTNTGPSTATGATVSDLIPSSLLNVTFTSVASGGATGNTSGSGMIDDTLTLPGGASVTYTVAGTIAPNASGTLTLTATAATPAGAFEADTTDNTATDTDSITPVPPPPPVNTAPTITGVADVQTATGTPVGPVTFAVADAETPAGALSVSVSSSNPGLIPASGVVVSGSGGQRAVTVTPAAGQTGTAVVTLTVSDGALTATETFVVTVTDPLPPPPPPPPPPPGGIVKTPFAVGIGEGGGSQISGYNPDGSLNGGADPFPGFAGGTRVAVADVTGDGVPDTVVGAGPGGAPVVKVIDGKTGADVMSLTPFEASFTGGVFVASADVNGDGFSDIVITPDQGGGPRVKVISGKDGGTMADFFGIDDPAFRGGARAALADVNGDGTPDLLVAAGFGGGPRLAGFDGKQVAAGNASVKLFADFFVFEQTLRNGVYVAGGDIDGDGKAEVIAGGGPGGGPRVYAVSGQGLLASNGQTQTPVANFFAGDTDNRGGVRVSTKELDGDGRADLVVGAGEGAGSRVTGYLGKDLATAGTPPEEFAFDAFPGFTGGVYVG